MIVIQTMNYHTNYGKKKTEHLTTCLYSNAISKRIELEHPARSHLKDLSQIFQMVMDFALFFSLLGCETLTNKMFAFFFRHSYAEKSYDFQIVSPVVISLVLQSKSIEQWSEVCSQRMIYEYRRGFE